MAKVQFGGELAQFGGELAQFGGENNLTASIASTLTDTTSDIDISTGLTASIDGTLVDTTSDINSSLDLSASVDSTLIDTTSDINGSLDLSASVDSVLVDTTSDINSSLDLSASIASTLVDATSNINSSLDLSASVDGTLVDTLLSGDYTQFGGELAQFGGETVFGGELHNVDFSLSASIASTLVDTTSDIDISTGLTASIDGTLVDTSSNINSSLGPVSSGLDTRALSISFDDIVRSGLPDIVQSLGEAYYNYSKTGVVASVDISFGGDFNLVSEMWYTDNTNVNIDDMAIKIATYWRTVNKPGYPTHGGTVVSDVTVQIDETTIAVAIRSKITDVIRVDSMYSFQEAVEDSIKLAEWHVTEVVNGTPTVFIEYIT